MKRLIEYFDSFSPTLKQCWAIVIYLCIAGQLLFLAVALPVRILTGRSVADFNMLLQYLIPFLPPLAYVLYKGRKARNSMAGDGCQYTGRPVNTPLSCSIDSVYSIGAAAFLVVLAILLLGIIADPLINIVEMPEAIKDAIYAPILDRPVIAAVTIIVAAPVMEEFFLRGMILRGLLHHTAPVTAIVWSAAFFALIHMNLYQATGAFIMGCLIGWIYYKSGSLFLAILAHAVNNGSAFLLTVACPEMDLDATLQMIVTEHAGLAVYIALIAAALLFFCGTVYLINKLFSKKIVW